MVLLFLLRGAFAYEAVIVENDSYRVVACASSRTVRAAEFTFTASDFVEIIDKKSAQVFKFSPVLFHESGGGGVRFQAFTRAGYAFFLDDTRILDITAGDDLIYVGGFFVGNPGEPVADLRPLRVLCDEKGARCERHFSSSYEYKDFTCEDFFLGNR